MGLIEGFQVEPLRNMVAVGAVDSQGARLWVRAERPGWMVAEWWPEKDSRAVSSLRFEVPSDPSSGGTASVRIPAGEERLRAQTVYGYRIVAEDGPEVLGEGQFETSPADSEAGPSRFSIAVLSCNQPFDTHGRVERPSREMLVATRRLLEERRTKLVLTVGDQMYGDYPQGMSLFDPDYFPKVGPPGRKGLLECSVDEVRRLYHQRYQVFWAMPEWQWLHANYPCYPMFDDHEIVDNWGSDPKHTQEDWQRIGQGARWAFDDFQALRVRSRTESLPEDFDFEVEYGPMAIYVLDLRSNRRASDGGRLFSQAQHESIEKFLERHRSKAVIGMVLTVPIVHMPRGVARFASRLSPNGEDFSDRWSSLGHVKDRDRLLKTLHRHQERCPEQLLLLLSGDIHVGCVHEMQWAGTNLCFHQLISSAITHVTGKMVKLAADLSIRFNRCIETMDQELRADVRLLKGERGRRNPFLGLNIGLVEVEQRAGEDVDVRLALYGHRGEEPQCVYRSPPLRGVRREKR